MEMCFECIPQALIQMVALALTPNEDRDFFQYFSLALSMLSAGFVITSNEWAFDMSASSRKGDPRLVGYISDVVISARWQYFALITFFSTFMACKILSLSLLIVASSAMRYVMTWLGTECILLLGVRVFFKNWRGKLCNN